MQPFVPARLKRAFSTMRLKMPGGLDGVQNADLESSRKMVEGVFRNRERPPMREIRDVYVSAKEYGVRPDDEWQGLIRFFEPESCPVGARASFARMGSAAAFAAMTLVDEIRQQTKSRVPRNAIVFASGGGERHRGYSLTP